MSPVFKEVPWPIDDFDEATCALLAVIFFFEKMDHEQRMACLGYLNARFPDFSDR